MTEITLEAMKSQLHTFDEIISRLEMTEPIEEIIIDGSQKVSFKFDTSWEESIKHSSMDDLVGAYVTIGGNEYPFSKEGIIAAAGQIGIGAAYLTKSPSVLSSANLTYWFNAGLGDSQYKLLVVKGVASAFSKTTITAFSNVELAHSIYDGIQDFYGEGTEVYGDFKFSNSLTRTDVRFIVPRDLHAMRDTNMLDVPPNAEDLWSAGINMTNSLTGKSQTSIETYLLRWWCTNGAIRTNGDVGTWNRKSDGQNEESVYQWAASAVDDVLGGMERAFDAVQALAYVKPNASTSDVLGGIYKDYKVPVGNREGITNAVVSAQDIHMYSIMNAITEQANDPQLNPKRQDMLMRIGGSLPEHYFDRTKAQVFQQGQKAGLDAPNPYEIETRRN